jgi:Flp pilus assembly protein protease CpaA
MDIGNYYFVFFIAFLWLVFASVQDIRKREISNWLNFSLIGIGLTFKLIYSMVNWDWNMFIYGLLGFAVFYIIALIVYYLGAVGGGDAKLLMGIGAILPSNGLEGIVYSGLLFLGIFLVVGAVYSLIYSAVVSINNRIRFNAGFKHIFGKVWKVYYLVIPLFILVLFFNLGVEIILLSGLVVLLPLIYAYTKAVDLCMIKLVSWEELQEGDWIINDIKIGNRIIRNRANGLSEDEIKLLRKMKRNVFVKYGVPFAPVFLISFLVMVFFFLRFGADFSSLLALWQF